MTTAQQAASIQPTQPTQQLHHVVHTSQLSLYLGQRVKALKQVLYVICQVCYEQAVSSVNGWASLTVRRV